MNRSRFQIAKKDIVSALEALDKRVLAYSDISGLLGKNQSFWRLPIGLTTQGFIQLLTTNTKLKRHAIDFPKRRIIRYSWGDTSAFSLALSLEKDSYFTHYTALYLHNLTNQIPKTIYVNFEQTEKNIRGITLSQEGIDRAFSRPARMARNIAEFSDYRICLINGKFTDRIGVIEMMTSEDGKVRVTDIERTLIDIAVSPSFSGGINEVLSAYRNAADKVSINKLAASLKKMNYIYPHHQAIGFYLERAGVYRESQMQLLRDFEFRYDFYLTHQMKDREYSKEWRLYYPRGF